MAIIRNIRNIIEAGVDEKHMSKVLRAISDPAAVRKSKQLPFRFLSAYKSVADISSSKVFDALESAIDAAVDNLPKLPGTTVIAIDTSGSMRAAISAKSSVRCCEISMILGVIANRICENAIVYTFDTQLVKKAFSKRNGILYTAMHEAHAGGGTFMHLPFAHMISNRVYADRVIVISDNECNWDSNTVQKYADEYRHKTGIDLWVHAIDLQGYGTQQFTGARTNIIAGWSEKVFDFINLAEQGEGTLEKTIAAYQW